MLIRNRYRTVEELAATPDRALRGLRNLGPKALAPIHQAVTALYAGSLNPSPGPMCGPTPLPGAGTATELAAFSTGQLLALLGACVHELRRRDVNPTIDNIPDAPGGDLHCT